MRIAFVTLGCKVNQSETALMEQQFVRDGFELVDSGEEADVYVLNSCTVTAQSDKKSRQILRRFRRQNPGAVVALCGCFPQAFPQSAQLLTEADVVLGTISKDRLLEAVKGRLAGGERFVEIGSHQSGQKFESGLATVFQERTRGFVKIQDGCERFCAYCIIPTARGPVRSKPLEDLRRELTDLAAAGYREVVLVGINLSCYGVDLGLHLVDAVEAACGIKGIDRVRLGSLEPELLDDDAVGRLAVQAKLCPQFHLSLQSGSDGTLRRMNRHYDGEEYRKIVKRLEVAFPDCAITTDIMVGFPGETEEEFGESMAFVDDIGIARAHVFAYSRRPGTAADRMEGQLPQRVKVERSRQMVEVTNGTRRRFLENQLGKTQSVLFEAQRKDGRWEGYTPNYTLVIVESPEKLAGRLLPVLVEAVVGDHCTGVLA